jgi:hypothetical protein
MNRRLCFLPGLLLLLVSACAPVPFPRTALTPTVPGTAAALTDGLWSAGSDSLLIRQSALFELQGLRVPIAGVMKLDLAAREARLVGMNDMGVKLYDLSIAATASQTHFLLPDLAAYPGFSEAVALSVRRIFLAPAPSADDTLERTPRRYLLTRKCDDGGTLRFTFGGADAQLLEKSCRGPAASWRVRYYQYQPQLGRLFPAGIVLDDERAGYRLTLWIESVEKIDE